MPYLQNDPNQDDELAIPQGTPAPVAAGGGSAFAGGGEASGGGAAAGAKPAKAGGGYTNLLTYLGANQGAGATTGEAAANVVDQAGQQATKSRDAYGTSADHELNQFTDTGADQSVLGRIKNGSGAGAPKAGYAGPELDDVRVDYKGPTTTGGFGADTAGLQAATLGDNEKVYGAATNARGGQTGVAALLRTAYQQPSYTSGENGFDAFLAGGTAGGQQALGRASGVAADTASGYQNLNNRLTGRMTSAAARATGTNATYQGAIDAAKAAGTAQASADLAAAEPSVGDERRTASYTPPEDPSTVPTTGDETRTTKNPNNQSPSDIGSELRYASTKQPLDDANKLGGIGPAPINANVPALVPIVKPLVTPGNPAAPLLPDPVTPVVSSAVDGLLSNIPGYSKIKGRVW